MLNSKRSRHRSDVFRNRFEQAGTDAAPVRHLQRAREERIGAAVQVLLLGGFVVALALLARSVVHLFARHGSGLSPWTMYLCLAGIAIVVLFTIRRIWLKVNELRDLWQEVRELEARVRALRAQLRRRD
jgi:hypothetical protein